MQDEDECAVRHERPTFYLSRASFASPSSFPSSSTSRRVSYDTFSSMVGAGVDASASLQAYRSVPHDAEEARYALAARQLVDSARTRRAMQERYAARRKAGGGAPSLPEPWMEERGGEAVVEEEALSTLPTLDR